MEYPSNDCFLQNYRGLIWDARNKFHFESILDREFFGMTHIYACFWNFFVYILMIVEIFLFLQVCPKHQRDKFLIFFLVKLVFTLHLHLKNWECVWLLKIIWVFPYKLLFLRNEIKWINLIHNIVDQEGY